MSKVDELIGKMAFNTNSGRAWGRVIEINSIGILIRLHKGSACLGSGVSVPDGAVALVPHAAKVTFYFQ